MNKEKLDANLNEEKSLQESIPENVETENKEQQTENIPKPEKTLEEKEAQDSQEKVLKPTDTKSVIGKTNQQSYQETRRQEIDNILSDGLSEVFLGLDPAKQQEFKQAGEVTVNKINGLLDKAKVKINKIVGLIKKWLGILPNANKYYLEQEAKIKADKIIQLKNK